jgi:4-amino-4-deoxy-L-arabinose transferase-like glycosyltransferase
MLTVDCEPTDARAARSWRPIQPRSYSVHWFFAFSALVPLCAFLFFYRLTDRDLWSSHEARAAMDAQDILDGTGTIVPHLFDGRAELQKPPLYYWIVALPGALGGGTVTALDVRLPAALAATGCVLGFAALGRYCGRWREGLLAAVILATVAHFTWLARIGRIDAPLTLTTGIAASAGFLALRQRPLRSPLGERRASGGFFLAVAYLATVAGILLKGPVGFILPAAALAGYLLGEGEWPALWEVRAWLTLVRRLGLWWGLPLVVVLALPWFVAADEDTGGELFRVFFWYHNVERALGGGHLRSNPWWFYGPQFIVDFLPWSPFVVGMAVLAWRRGLLRDDPLARFGLAWFVGVLTVLSCARFKRADYLLPAYPGAALFLACVGSRLARDLRRPWLVDRLLPAGLTLVMALFWAVRVEIKLPAEEPFRDYRPLAAVIRREAPAPAEVVFFRTEAHALAFRVGRPLAVLVEWPDLQTRLMRPGPHYVVTQPETASECRLHLPGFSWEKVSGTVELAGGAHERPLLLLRAEQPSGYVSTAP